ncbi:MAG TPA: hypothetical protein PLI86_00285 [bacterium]|nr:hypothetical protein [bacterium]
MRSTDYYAVAQALDEKLDSDTREYLDRMDEERRRRSEEDYECED